MHKAQIIHIAYIASELGDMHGLRGIRAAETAYDLFTIAEDLHGLNGMEGVGSPAIAKKRRLKLEARLNEIAEKAGINIDRFEHAASGLILHKPGADVDTATGMCLWYPPA